MVIGLMGAVINNSNLGCLALSYSLIKTLEAVTYQSNIDATYTIFDIIPEEKKTLDFCKRLGVDRSKIRVVQYGAMGNPKEIARQAFINLKMIKEIKKCDVIIDITQGDSFTDIYGNLRFVSWSRIKMLVENLNVPLILGPQTYGPFISEKHKQYAKQIVEKATLVMSRDAVSAEYLSSFSNAKTYITTDLAFLLPYEKPQTNPCHIKKQIGVNISGLLVADKSENTEINFQLRTDYDEYIFQVLKWLSDRADDYEVHLIPHVEDDCVAIARAKNKFPNFIVHEAFTSPIDAKNCIAGMDIFIGARMHATIAAFSSGVATIPTGYSRKFKGLFESYNYEYVIDFQEMSTQEAVSQTIEYIKNYMILKEVIHESNSSISEQIELTKNILQNALIRSVR